MCILCKSGYTFINQGLESFGFYDLGSTSGTKNLMFKVQVPVSVFEIF